MFKESINVDEMFENELVVTDVDDVVDHGLLGLISSADSIKT